MACSRRPATTEQILMVGEADSGCLNQNYDPDKNH